MHQPVQQIFTLLVKKQNTKISQQYYIFLSTVYVQTVGAHVGNWKLAQESRPSCGDGCGGGGIKVRDMCPPTFLCWFQIDFSFKIIIG
jgi:hypothetical protein